MLSALSAHRTKSAGRFCTRVQKVYFNETAECTVDSEAECFMQIGRLYPVFGEFEASHSLAEPGP